MNRVQQYFFWQSARALMLIVTGLVGLSLIAQGLSQTDILVESRQSALTYVQIVLLSAPQVVALLLPLSLFVAVVWSLNTIHRDSEVVVAQAAGMTAWQTVSPLLRLATLAALMHLALSLWAQPAAQRALRDTINTARLDITASLIREGQFTRAGDNLTFYAQDVTGNQLTGIMISDTRPDEAAADYLADTGALLQADGGLTIVLYNATRLQKVPDGTLNVLEFEQYPFELTPFLKEDGDIILKSTDRFLGELLFIDENSQFETRRQGRFLAEAYSRVFSPLYNIVLALLGVLTVLGGDFNRSGYLKRIITGSLCAAGIFLSQLTLQANATGTAILNYVQAGLPIILCIGLLIMILGPLRLPRRRHPSGPNSAGAAT